MADRLPPTISQPANAAAGAAAGANGTKQTGVAKAAETGAAGANGTKQTGVAKAAETGAAEPGGEKPGANATQVKQANVNPAVAEQGVLQAAAAGVAANSSGSKATFKVTSATGAEFDVSVTATPAVKKGGKRRKRHTRRVHRKRGRCTRSKRATRS